MIGSAAPNGYLLFYQRVPYLQLLYFSSPALIYLFSMGCVNKCISFFSQGMRDRISLLPLVLLKCEVEHHLVSSTLSSVTAPAPLYSKAALTSTSEAAYLTSTSTSEAFVASSKAAPEYSSLV